MGTKFMGTKMKIESNYINFELNEKEITGYKLVLEAKNSKYAKSNDTYQTLTITGDVQRIVTNNEFIYKMIKDWTKIRYGISADFYVKVTVTQMFIDEVFKEIVFSNAYMRDFTETINPNTGEGNYIREPDIEGTASGPENSPYQYNEDDKYINISNEKGEVKNLNFSDKKKLADWWIDEYVSQKNSENIGNQNYEWLNKLSEKYLDNLIDLYSSFSLKELINECYNNIYDSNHAGNAQKYIGEDDENVNCYVYALNGCLGLNGKTGSA